MSAGSEGNGIIRWRDLNSAMKDLRNDIAETDQDLRQGQMQNSKDIGDLKADIAGMKAELRIWGAIILSALATVIGLLAHHLSP